MKKDLKICLRVAINPLSADIPCDLSTRMESVEHLIELTDDFYAKTDLYLKSILCPESYKVFMNELKSVRGSSSKKPDKEGESGVVMLSSRSTSDAFIYKGVTKDVDEGT